MEDNQVSVNHVEQVDEPRKIKRDRTSSQSNPDHASNVAETVEAFQPNKISPPTTFEEVSRAKIRIMDGIKASPCDYSHILSASTKCNLYFKKEYFHRTGSFKERGARNALKRLSDEQKRKGVIAASAGNHALGLAYHGHLLNIPVTLVMPEVAPLTKVENCKSFGANVMIHGAHIGEAMIFAKEKAKKEGLRYINGYDDHDIVAGQGTIGLEILEQVPNVDAIIVPVGGGGLIAGISLAVKTLKPDVQIIGVEGETCPSFSMAMKEGKPVTAPVSSTLADGLAVPLVGANAFQVAKDRVDKVITVPERAIALSVLRLMEKEKAIVEGAGAAGLAALLTDRLPELQNKNVVCLLCGGNIDITTMGRVIERGLAADGRLARFVVSVSDRPGSISRITKLIAEIGASVKDIFHERAWLDSDIMSVQIKFVVETRSREHARELHQALLDAKYKIIWGFDLAESQLADVKEIY